MNIGLREIEYILTIAEEGTITRAAQKLYIAQPSLSQAVKKIEAEVRAPLFYRVKNRLQLTQEGELFVETGSRILKSIRDLENSIQDLAHLQSGRLSVGMPYHLGAVFVPPAVTIFQRRYPNITLQLYESNSFDLENRILNGLIDLALIPLPVETPGLYSRSFFTSRIVLLVPQNDPLNQFARDPQDGSRRKYFDLRNAEGHPFCIGNQGHRLRKVSEEIFSRAGITPRIALYSKNIETIQRLVAAGTGIALVPDCYLLRDIDQLKTNCYYLEPEQDVIWSIGTAYLDTGYLSFATQSFLDILNDLYGNHLSADGQVPIPHFGLSGIAGGAGLAG